jgi:hypothetical protein
MGDAAEAKKDGDTITISVRNQTGEATYFKVKMKTKMQK